MKNEKEIFENINSFLEGKIKVREFWKVSKQLQDDIFKPWDTNMWKVNREKKLKEECQTCGSKKNLTIQHTWHPDSLKTCISQAKMKYESYKVYKKEFLEYKNKCPKEILFTENVVKTKACPFCENLTIKFNPNLKEYTCIKSKYRGCKKTFEKPKILENKILIKNADKSSKYKYERYIEEFFLNKATRDWLEQFFRYIEMRDEDHYTACGDCAYKEDFRTGKIQRAKNRELKREKEKEKKKLVKIPLKPEVKSVRRRVVKK